MRQILRQLRNFQFLCGDCNRFKGSFAYGPELPRHLCRSGAAYKQVLNNFLSYFIKI